MRLTASMIFEQGKLIQFQFPDSIDSSPASVAFRAIHQEESVYASGDQTTGRRVVNWTHYDETEDIVYYSTRDPGLFSRATTQSVLGTLQKTNVHRWGGWVDVKTTYEVNLVRHQ